MPTRESIVSPFPPGSGRKMDYTWPDWNANSTGAVTNQIRDRPGAQAGDPSGSLTPGATGSLNVGTVNGFSCCRMINGANLNQGPTCIIDGAGRFHFSTLAANIAYSTLDDDYGVQRVYMVARVAATPADAADCGLQLHSSGNAGDAILRNAVPGWGIQFDNTGGCSLIQHGNSGAQTAVVLRSAAAGFVNTDPHKFEFRFINATPTANAVMKVFLDDAFILVRTWGVDDMPTPQSPGGNADNGFVVNVQQQSRNAELDVALVRTQRGATEQAVVS